MSDNQNHQGTEMNSNEKLASTPITFSYTVEDFVAASKLGAKLSRRWIVTRLSFITAMIALFVLFNADRNLLLGYLVVLVFGIALFIIILRFWILPRRAIKQFEQQPLAHLETTLTIENDGMTVQSARGESTLLWEDFHGWRANDEIILLYASPNWYWLVPRRLQEMGMPLDALETLLEERVGPQKK